MLKRFLDSKFRLINLQLYIITEVLKSTLASLFGMIILLLGISLFITEVSPWKDRIEFTFAPPFYSKEYFTLLLVIAGCGTISAFFFTIFFGFPLGRYLKKRVQGIADAVEALRRGKLDYRLVVEGEDELSLVSQQYNQMADRIETQVESLQRLVNQNADLLQQAQAAASLEERRKLARELHDAVSQQLFAVSMSMSALPRLMAQEPQRATELMLQIGGIVNQAQQELRALILHLRPVTLDGQTLVEGVGQLLSEIQEKYPDLQIEWKLQLDTVLESGIEDQLFRVIQEALSNTLRHANAKQFELKLLQKEDRIILRIEDNGVGFDLSQKKKSSYGLSTIQERIADIGGDMDLISFPGKGTRIDIRIPLKTL